MPEYTVAWTIQLDADSPRDAARQAREIQLDPNSIATFFRVTEVVDLMDGTEDEDDRRQ